MSTAVRQRNVKLPANTASPVASHLEVPVGHAESSIHHHKNGGNATTTYTVAAGTTTPVTAILANLLFFRNSKQPQQQPPSATKNHAILAWLVVLLLCYIVGPTALHVPKALYVWASRGFVTEHLLGAGIRDLVGSMIVDPHQLMVGDVDPPTPLAAYKDIVLDEYEAYRSTHELPVIADLDPDEQGPLDTKGVWKTLFLKAMGRYTCAAPHFPKTLEAVRNSGLTAYSIMFSRLAPGQTIEPHTGFSKMIQIYHLALKVPTATSENADSIATDRKEQEQPQEQQQHNRPYLSVKECEDEAETINCRSETYEWTEGREFIFDDSFTHHAVNPTAEERLVLFLHIKRIDFKGWREELIASVMCYIFSWVPFEGVMRLVRGTEKTCALSAPAATTGNHNGGASAAAAAAARR